MFSVREVVGDLILYCRYRKVILSANLTINREKCLSFVLRISWCDIIECYEPSLMTPLHFFKYSLPFLTPEHSHGGPHLVFLEIVVSEA